MAGKRTLDKEKARQGRVRTKKPPKPKKPTKVKPLMINGKAFCPICKERKYSILNYDVGSQEGFYKFKVFCSDCFVEFEYETIL